MIFYEKVLCEIIRFYFYLDHSRFLTRYSPFKAVLFCVCFHLRFHLTNESKMLVYVILSVLVLAEFGLLFQCRFQWLIALNCIDLRCMG